MSSSPPPSKKRHEISSSSHRSRRTAKTSGHHGGHLLPEPPSSIFPSNFGDLLRFLAVLSIAAVVAFACNSIFLHRHHSRRSRTPFCDTNTAHDFDDCEPCPEHGECSGGELVKCIFGHKRIGVTCVEDGRFNLTAKKFVDCVERRVCEARAEFLCQETGIVWFYVSDILKLMEELKTKENLALDDKTFSLVKQEALRNIEGSLETRIDSNGIKEFMCPDQLVVLHKPFCCSVKHWIYGHVLPISIISVLLAAGVASSLKIMKAKQLNGRAEQLYQQVIEILEEHATMHEISDPSNVKIQPCVVYSWLRDHLLSTKERKQPVLWKKVEELIQQDSRIDQYPKLIKGESRIVLEWQVKGSLSAKMKKRAKEAAGKVESRDLNHSGPEDRRHAEPLQSY